MARGQNLRGGRLPNAGRKPGTPNKFTVELKAMIEGALEEVAAKSIYWALFERVLKSLSIFSASSSLSRLSTQESLITEWIIEPNSSLLNSGRGKRCRKGKALLAPNKFVR